MTVKKNTSQRVRSLIQPFADRLGIGKFLRQGFIETRLIGEKAKFAVKGRPSPSKAILLAGSGRSGTTWITDVLCAVPNTQQVFEPLFPPWNAHVRQLTGWDSEDPHIRSIYLRPDEENKEWLSLWNRILTGQHRNYWTDYIQNSVLPDRFLVKEVRANMMLGWLYRQFRPRIVFIMRHPCAVIASRLAINWHADVSEILKQRALVHDYVAKYEPDIANETDLVGAHAVWWAVENAVALNELSSIPHFALFYEDIVLNPKDVLADLFRWLGYGQIPDEVIRTVKKPSRMSQQGGPHTDKLEHISRWRQTLPQSTQERIISWAHRMGVYTYDLTPLPARNSRL